MAPFHGVPHVRVFTSDTFVCCLRARARRGREGESEKAKDQTSSLAKRGKKERKNEINKERKKHASGKESVCIIDGCKEARR